MIFRGSKFFKFSNLFKLYNPSCSKMELTQTEKKLIKHLVEKELKEFEEEEETIRPPVGFLAAEEKYDILLKDLLKKL